MMRSLLVLCLVAGSVFGADPDRERKVKVALALAGAAQCGECKFDLAGCRKEATEKGRPLVLFVGAACGKCGTAATKAGAVACVVERYVGDDRPADQPRAVVLRPDGKGEFWIDATVDVAEAKVIEAIGQTKGKMPDANRATGMPLDWSK